MSNAASMAVVGGITRRIVKKYGVVDGINRKIYKGYVVVGGINRLRYIAEALAFTGNMSEPQVVDIDGVEYDLYTLTSSGNLSIYADDALFWMCGGGAGGESGEGAINSGHNAGRAGGGGAGAFCVSGELAVGKYPVEIGAGGVADKDGLATTLGEYTAEGGKTGTSGAGGSGGTGGGGAASGDYSGARNGVGGAGDQVDKYPFGLSNLGAHCAGGGGGMLNYSDSYMYITGGKGGTNGGHGNSSNGSTSTAGNGTGGEKGGGNGGGIGSDGKDATFYGSAGGGGGADISVYPYTIGKGGSGYQGVVYIAIPHKETIEPIVITKQPEDVTVAVNTNAKFTIEAEGVDVTYQWQYRTNPNGSWWDYPSSGTNKTLTVYANDYKNGYSYRCIITDAQGSTVTSDVVTLTVVPILITKQPENVTAAVKDWATFKCEAEGEGLTYQWKLQSKTGTTWSNSGATGATTNEVKFEVQSHHDGYKYCCEITDANGNTVTSDIATITLTSA